MGPAHLCDGIAGYPQPPFDPSNQSSFVLDHPNTYTIKSLSTNAIYYAAYKAMGEMGREIQAPIAETQLYEKKAFALKNNINKNFWLADKGRYGYLILADGKIDSSQEGIGISYALMFGIPDSEQAKQLFKNITLMPQGIPCVYPHFPRYNDAQPGRHNNIVWPMICGFWGFAAARYHRESVFTFELENEAHLALDTNKGNGNFREIYHPITGNADGGWQSGHQWKSCDHQTWSATAFLRLVFYGLFGMNFEPDGITFAPYLPDGYGEARLTNLKYRNTILSIIIKGKGSIVKSFQINGEQTGRYIVQADMQGKQDVIIELAGE
jgi:glycogen debranching enzyme